MNRRNFISKSLLTIVGSFTALKGLNKEDNFLDEIIEDSKKGDNGLSKGFFEISFDGGNTCESVLDISEIKFQSELKSKPLREGYKVIDWGKSIDNAEFSICFDQGEFYTLRNGKWEYASYKHN